MSSELPVIGLDKTPFGAVLKSGLEVVQQLDLPGIAKDNRHLRRFPWDDGLTCPYVTLSPSPEVISPDDGTNEQDDIGYGFMLAVVSANNGMVGDKWLDTLLYWRWQLQRAFLNQTRRLVLPDGTFQLRTIVRPGEALIPEAFRENRDAQYLFVQTLIRENRPDDFGA